MSHLSQEALDSGTVMTDTLVGDGFHSPHSMYSNRIAAGGSVRRGRGGKMGSFNGSVMTSSSLLEEETNMSSVGSDSGTINGKHSPKLSHPQSVKSKVSLSPTPSVVGSVDEAAASALGGGASGGKKKLPAGKRVKRMSVVHQEKIELQETMAIKPEGAVASVMLTLCASNPHVSFIVDNPVTLTPGVELFTMAMGPRPSYFQPLPKDRKATTQDKYEGACGWCL